MKKDSSQASADATAARKIRVLVVDDSDFARSSLVRWLASCGRLHIAGQAKNGLEGYALAAQLRPDLVVTDLQMPGATGLTLAELLRENYPAMRIVVMSAHDGPTLQARSQRHGADAFIPKQRLTDELPLLLDRLFPDTARLSNSTSQP